MGMTLIKPPVTKQQSYLQLTEQDKANILEIIRDGDYDLFDISFIKECNDRSIASAWLDKVSKPINQKFFFQTLHLDIYENFASVISESGQTFYIQEYRKFPNQYIENIMIDKDLYEYYKSELACVLNNKYKQ